MSLFDHSIKELEEKLHNKEITVQDLVKASFDRIRDVDNEIQAFLTLDEENAWKLAKELDENPEKTNLFGLPVGIKDNIVTKSIRTTSASKMLENFDNPLYDATVMEKLNEEKAVTIGKLNMDEFAMGSGTEESAFKLTRNPWNTDHVPGGSSGGSAAAVAAGQVIFSLASDTGGSIREPAAYCGVVGMKPTYGRVSRHGLIAYASSLDHIGPITRTVEDNARVLEVLAGHDERDSTTVNTEVPAYTEGLTNDVKGLRIAVPKEYFGEGVSEDVQEAVRKALKEYESLGAIVEEVSLPHSKYALSAYYLLASAESSASLARYDGVRYGYRSDNATNLDELYKLSRSEGFGQEAKRRIMLGTFALSSDHYVDYYKKAQQVRTLVKGDFEAIFEEYDVVIGPTTPTTAYKIGEESDDPMVKYMNDMLTVPANLAGIPAISLPCGFSDEGLPIGLQIMGNHFQEETVYRAAHAYEQTTDYHKQRPNIGGIAQ
jgi:aspartyl-tRNA(Asn)/glutamyl-tRNA(Gln) amidotransferase subunit A